MTIEEIKKSQVTLGTVIQSKSKSSNLQLLK